MDMFKFAILVLFVFVMVFAIVNYVNTRIYGEIHKEERCQEVCEEKGRTLLKANWNYCTCKYNLSFLN